MGARIKRNVVLLFSLLGLVIILLVAFRISNTKLSLGPFSDIAAILESFVVIITILTILYFKFSSEKMQINLLLPSSKYAIGDGEKKALFNYFKVKVLIIREGSESKLENRLLDVRFDNKGLANFHTIYNTTLGFEFKCFLELNSDLDLNNVERDKLTEIFQRDMKYMGYQEVSRITLDNRIWFLFPDVMQIGVICASEREAIRNNIYYPTLPNLINPHLVLGIKIPVAYNGINFIEEMKFILQIIDAKKEIVYKKAFNIESQNDKLNMATLKLPVDYSIWSKHRDSKFVFKVEMDDKSYCHEILDNFQRASDKINLHEEIDQVSESLSIAIKENRNQNWNPKILDKLGKIKRQFTETNVLCSDIDIIEKEESQSIENLCEKLEALQAISKQTYDVKLLESSGDFRFRLQNDAEKVYENILDYNQDEKYYNINI